MNAVAISAHRPPKLGGYEPNPIQDWVREHLASAIRRAYYKGYLAFICGGALGGDWIAEEEIIALKRDHPEVQLVLALPFKGYNARWPRETIDQFEQRIMTRADAIHYICQPPFANWKMQQRNQWMVDHSTGPLIAVWDGLGQSGTANCVDYARYLKRDIFHINPLTQKVGWYISRETK